MADKVNLAEKLASFSDHWARRIVARYNDNEVRLVKVEGEFIWHQHDDPDEQYTPAPPRPRRMGKGWGFSDWPVCGRASSRPRRRRRRWA